jgi:hypothetical protein
MTPFEEVYRQNPLSFFSYIPWVLKVQEVEKTLTVCASILRALKDNLVMTQSHMKQQAYQGRSKRQFSAGDQVFLHLQPYKQTSLKVEHCQNISPKFYGPYTILKRMGPVAYQLALLSHSKIHLVFHVSFLKKVVGTKCQTQTNISKLDVEGSIWLHP